MRVALYFTKDELKSLLAGLSFTLTWYRGQVGVMSDLIEIRKDAEIQLNELEAEGEG